MASLAVRDLCLGSPLEPHRGTPIDTNFEFDVQLPPKPSPTAVLGMTFENGPSNTPGPPPGLAPMPAGNNPSFVRVTIPLAGTGATPDDVYARKIYVGWIAPP